MTLPQQFIQAAPVLEYIEANGYDAYFVGGCVRDLLLEQRIGDIDIATSAPPEIVQSIFRKVIPVGIEHGTVIVRYNKQSYEVTTFRVESEYSDKRHPDDVQFVNSIEEDLKRRDFTMNALAMTKDGDIIDPFSGKKDLYNNVIRTVGTAQERFKEDPLRIMRALRFSSQHGFHIENSTLEAMTSLSQEIETIAVERITQETEKFFAGSYIQTGLYYFKRTAIDEYLPILKRYPVMMKSIPENMKPLESFAAAIALFHTFNPSISIYQWVKAWKCSNDLKYKALNLVNAIKHYRNWGMDRWLVYNLFPVNYKDFRVLTNILFNTPVSDNYFTQLIEALPIHSKKELAIDGTKLLQLYPDWQPGQWIGNTLNILEKRVVLGYLQNEENELKEWLKWNPPVMI